MNATKSSPARAKAVATLLFVSLLTGGGTALLAQQGPVPPNQIGLPDIDCARDKTVALGADWEFDSPTVRHLSCDGWDVSKRVVYTITNALCGRSYEAIRKWEVEDNCGNDDSCKQVVTVLDPTVVTISCPPDKTAECGDSWDFDLPTAVDQRDGSLASFRDVSTVTNRTCAGTFSVTRTWEAIDACGSSSRCSQTITVRDTTPPTIFCAADRQVRAGEAWDFDAPAAVDGCGEVTLNITGTITNATACIHSFTVTRTWIATDACGNVSGCAQTITVADDEAPLMSGVSEKTVEWGEAWSFDPPSATDLVDGANVSLTVVSTRTNRLCGQGLAAVRVWRAQDACGNAALWQQIVTVQDTQPPVFSALAAGGTYSCLRDVPAAPVVTAFDPAGGAVPVNLFSTTNGTCPTVIVHTWTATDSCENSAVVSQTVLVDPAPLAVLSAPSDQTVCPGGSVRLCIGVTNACSAAYQWLKDGEPIAGATGHCLDLQNLTSTDAGVYCVRVLGDFCSGELPKVSRCATLTVTPEQAAAPLPEVTACIGETAVFNAPLTGANLRYVWRKGSSVIQGEVSATLAVLVSDAQAAGDYAVEIAGACSSTVSSGRLTVLAAPAASPLGTLMKRTGESATFRASAPGFTPGSIIWRHNGSVIAGQTGETLTVPALTEAHGGSYTVEIPAACGTVTSAGALTIIQATTASGCVLSHWMFDEVSGGSGFDSAGQNHGVLANNPGRGAGVFGRAITFNGSNQSVSVPDTDSLDLGSTFTISLWFKPALRLDSTSGRMVLLNKASSYELAFNHAAADGRLAFVLNGGAVVLTSATAAWAADHWRHLACTFDGATIRLYVDGVLECSRPTPVVPEVTGSPLQIGGSAGSYFAGSMDDVRLYCMNLSAMSVRELWHGASGAGGQWVNTPPVITSIADRAVADGQATGPLSFSVGDIETPAANLQVFASSSDASLVPAQNIVLAGSGANRTVSVTAAANVSGQADVTLTVSDGQATATIIFKLTVIKGPTRARLVVRTTGQGSVTPDLNGHELFVGQSYSLAAVPAAGQVFTGWSGGVSGSSSALTFTMRSNLVIEANFAPNPFLALRNTYNGLFHEADEVRQETAGFITLAMTAKGTYTGRLQIGAKNQRFAGKFDARGNVTNVIRRVRTNSLVLELHLGLDANPDQITGRINAGAWTANVLADRAVFHAKTNPAPYAGRYTMLLPGCAHDLSAPGGDGFAAVVVGANGTVTMAGTLADGTRVTQRVPLYRDGQWPLYASLYRGRGSLLSWQNFGDHATDDVNGLLSWIRPAVTNAKYFSEGFSFDTFAVGSRYARPANRTDRLLEFSNGQVVFTSAEMPYMTNAVTLTPDNRVINLSSNKLALTINRANGLFTGHCADQSTGAKTSFRGALLQKQNRGAGFCLGTNSVGRVTFEAAP